MPHSPHAPAPAGPQSEPGASPRAAEAVLLPAEVAPDSFEPDVHGKAGPSKQVAWTEETDAPVWAPFDAVLPSRPLQDALKRAFDVGCAGLALLCGLPVLALIALAVKLGSEGPVLYRQVRVGRYGRCFTIYKFRSMTIDAERHGPRWARSNDTRVTRIGGILRRTSLDELPQLWNILIGDMSFIGPRPERPVFVARFREQIPEYDLRHAVRPGLSGWAQVNGLRGNVSIEDRTVYDVWYVRHFSLWLDVRVFFRTFSAVIAGE